MWRPAEPGGTSSSAASPSLEIGRRNALHGAHRPVAASSPARHRATSRPPGIGQDARRKRGALDRQRRVVGDAQAADPRHQFVRRQAEHHHLFGRGRDKARGRAIASAPLMPRRAMSSVNEVSRDSDCSTRSHARRDEGAGAMALHQHAALDQILHRLAHGDARNVGLDGDVALRRQRVARPDDAATDRILDVFLQLQIERRAALRRLPRASKISGRRPQPWRRLFRFAKARTAICTAPPSASPSGSRSSAR